MRRLVGLIVCLLLCGTPLFAVDYFMPTTMGNSAYAKGLGLRGFENSAVAVLENPAKLSDMNYYSLSGFTTTVMDEFIYRNLALAKRLNSKWAIGVAYAELGVDDIPHTDLVMDDFDEELKVIELTRYVYRNYVAKTSVQYNYTSSLSLGTSLSYYNTSLWTSHGSGVNADIAVQYQSSSGLTELSVVATNVIPNLNVSYVDGSTETLPMRTSIGLKRRLRFIDVYGQLLSPTLSESLYLGSLGVEYKLPIVPLKLMGSWYQFDVFDEVRDAYTTGIQLDLHWLVFNYAFEKSDYPLTDNKHYFSLSVGY